VTVHQRQTARRRRLGIQLRRLREDADLTIKLAAAQLGYSNSKLSRIENGKISATPGDVRKMLRLYGASKEQQDDLLQVVHEERQKKWWQPYSDVFESPFVTYEAAATTIDCYGGLLIPGLLQTEEYAGAVLRAVRPELPHGEVARRIEFRMLRRTILARDDPPKFSVVLDEAALRRPVGSAHVMSEQIRRLLEFSRHPSITLQVLELESGEHASMDGGFVLLHFEDEQDGDLVFFDTPIRRVAYSDDSKVVALLAAGFTELQRAALDPDESEAFLTRLTKEL
jgi:transcriptional regulator with XRE-family HTH domain